MIRDVSELDARRDVKTELFLIKRDPYDKRNIRQSEALQKKSHKRSISNKMKPISMRVCAQQCAVRQKRC